MTRTLPPDLAALLAQLAELAHERPEEARRLLPPLVAQLGGGSAVRSLALAALAGRPEPEEASPPTPAWLVVPEHLSPYPVAWLRVHQRLRVLAQSQPHQLAPALKFTLEQLWVDGVHDLEPTVPVLWEALCAQLDVDVQNVASTLSCALDTYGVPK